MDLEKMIKANLKIVFFLCLVVIGLLIFALFKIDTTNEEIFKSVKNWIDTPVQKMNFKDILIFLIIFSFLTSKK